MCPQQAAYVQPQPVVVHLECGYSFVGAMREVGEVLAGAGVITVVRMMTIERLQMV